MSAKPFSLTGAPPTLTADQKKTYGSFEVPSVSDPPDYLQATCSKASRRPMSRRWVAPLLLAAAAAAVSIAGANAAAVDASSAAEPNLLPPTPGENPTACEGDSAPYSPCGVDRYCSPVDSQAATSYCLHRALFPGPPTWRDGAALLLIAVCCFLAAMAGIGGGGLLFPIIILIWNFTPKEAAVLSHAGVFGNCLGQQLFYMMRSWRRRRGGEGDNGLYAAVAGAVMMILPGLLAGGSAAISMEGLIPSTAILILALLTLLLGVTKTFMKAHSMWKKEEDAALGQGETMSAGGRSDEESASSQEQAFAYESLDADGEAESSKDDDGSCAFDDAPDAESEAVASSSSCSPLRCSIEKLIASCWALDALTFLTMRGSAGTASVRKCSPAYFTMVFLPVGFALFFVWRGRVILRRQLRTEEHEREGREAATESRRGGRDAWDENPPVREKEFSTLVWWLPLASFVIGLFSALLGIGGGEILGPILLLLNMNPQRSSTTTSVIALLNSGTNNLHNALAGAIVSPGYFAFVWSAALAAGVGGRSLAMTVSARSGKDSIIAFSLAFLLAIAASLVAWELFSTPPDWSTEGVC